MSVESFFNEYFILPIINGTGYNIYNTIAYGVIFIVASLLVYKVLIKMKIKIDEKFIISSIPFIVLGGFLRAAEDIMQSAGLGKNILLITPLIYVVVFVIAFFSLVIIKSFTNNFHKPWSFVGIICLLSFSPYLLYAKSFLVEAFATIVFLSLIWIIIIFGLGKITSFFKKINAFVLSSHMFDATTTFVALSNYSYFEQHVVTGFFINMFGPAVVFALKFIVVSLVLLIFDKNFKKNENNYLKFIVLLLGLGPGMRNFLRIIFGV